MNKIKNLLSVSLGKIACLAFLLTVVFAAATPALAQTADVRYAGVFYADLPGTMNAMYCESPTTWLMPNLLHPETSLQDFYS